MTALRGLRTHEDEAFQVYFRFVQRAAAERGCVFFLDCGEGRDLITDEYEGEDLSGWLVPMDKADEFERVWKQGRNETEEPEEWDDCYCFARWDNTDGLRISFMFY